MAKKPRPLADQKGHLLEEIAAMMHDGHPAVTVQVRARLPPISGRTTQDPPEIDVLLSGEFAGYPIRLAIECKNERKRTTVNEIRDFADKLQDVGIPQSQGIFISAAGYTRDALRRAGELRIRPLELRGLTADRLAAAVEKALHTIVFLVAEIRQISQFDQAADDPPPGMSVSRLEQAPPPGRIGLPLVQHHVWQLWTKGTIPAQAGPFYCMVRLPPKFVLIGKSKPLSSGMLIIEVIVGAVTLGLAGTARRYELVNRTSDALERALIQAEFPESTEPLPFKLVTFRSEEELEAHLAGGPSVQLLTRVRVPRIIAHALYWPPTPGALERLRALHDSGQPITFEAVEGLDLARAWDFEPPTDNPHRP